MKFEMFDIENYDRWGDLVKKWARDASSRPNTFEEFKTELERAGVEAKFPRPFHELLFVERSSADTTLTIYLPPPELIKQAEDDLQTQNYPLPQIYPDHMRDPSLKVNTVAEKLLFHSKRVGEYTIKFCG
jgi:hypothetical protein